ncbi:NINE protein [Alcaligenaceae bacterium]|nr:NINE protein [Alcaligenaceae bacterium]
MKEKKKLWAYTLWCVFGFFGGHRFYLQKAKTGAAFPLLIVLAFAFSSSWGAAAALIVAGWAAIDLFLIPGMVRSCNNRTQPNKEVVDPHPPPLSPSDLKKSLAAHNEAIAEYFRAKGPRADRFMPPADFRLKSIRSESSEPAFDFQRGGQYEIEYADADGVVTTRTIDVLSTRGGRIRAWCHLRQEERTFLSDRVLWACQAAMKPRARR